MARLDALRRSAVVAGQAFTLSGIAFAGERGIERVEISLDSGGTWQDCVLVEGGNADVWVTWIYEWQQPITRDHTLMCRATDMSGVVQTATAQSAFPDGASGCDRVSVTV